MGDLLFCAEQVILLLGNLSLESACCVILKAVHMDGKITYAFCHAAALHGLGQHEHRQLTCVGTLMPLVGPQTVLMPQALFNLLGQCCHIEITLSRGFWRLEQGQELREAYNATYPTG